VRKLFTILLVAVTTAAHADSSANDPRLRKALFTVFFAESCSRKYADPALYEGAVEALERLFREIRPEHASEVRQWAEQNQKDQAASALNADDYATEALCDRLRQAMASGTLFD